MKKLLTETIFLPADWASSLINGDNSGLDDADLREIKAFQAEHPYYGPCLGCTDEPESRPYKGLLTDCLEYTFPVQVTRKSGNLEYLIYPAHKFDEPLPWQKAGLTWTASGYGKKIATSKVVYLAGRRYRIYCTIYSNIGTCWITYQGRKVIVE